jgi:hypothetical protein
MEERRRTSDHHLAEISANITEIKDSVTNLNTYLLGNQNLGIKGKVHELDETVQKHETAYQRGKGIMALFSFAFALGAWEWVKNHMGVHK